MAPASTTRIFIAARNITLNRVLFSNCQRNPCGGVLSMRRFRLLNNHRLPTKHRDQRQQGNMCRESASQTEANPLTAFVVFGIGKEKSANETLGIARQFAKRLLEFVSKPRN